MVAILVVVFGILCVVTVAGITVRHMWGRRKTGVFRVGRWLTDCLWVLLAISLIGGGYILSARFAQDSVIVAEASFMEHIDAPESSSGPWAETLSIWLFGSGFYLLVARYSASLFEHDMRWLYYLLGVIAIAGIVPNFGYSPDLVLALNGAMALEFLVHLLSRSLAATRASGAVLANGPYWVSGGEGRSVQASRSRGRSGRGVTRGGRGHAHGTQKHRGLAVATLVFLCVAVMSVGSRRGSRPRAPHDPIVQVSGARLS